MLHEKNINSQDSHSELIQCKDEEDEKLVAVVFESIQVMDGDNTDCIPDLLLAEDADEVDSAQVYQDYGIDSFFKVRVEIADINQDQPKEDNNELIALEELTSEREECLRLAFVLPANRALNLLDKMVAQFDGVVGQAPIPSLVD